MVKALFAPASDVVKLSNLVFADISFCLLASRMGDEDSSVSVSVVGASLGLAEPGELTLTSSLGTLSSSLTKRVSCILWVLFSLFLATIQSFMNQ